MTADELLQPIPDDIATQFQRLVYAAQQGVLCVVKAKESGTSKEVFVTGILIRMPNGEYACEPVGTISEAPFLDYESPAFPERN